MTIIILNCYSRNALAVINSVKEQYQLIGGDVDVKSKFLKPEPLFKSPRLSGVFRYPNPETDPEGFVESIVSVCRQYGAVGVIPTGTTSTNYLSKYKADIENRTRAKMAVEDFDKLWLLTDKWNTVQIAEKIGVPVPRTRLVTFDDEFIKDVSTWHFPLIVKPRISFASHGIRFVESVGQLERLLTESKDVYTNQDGELSALIQEVHKGELHDVVACSSNGELLSVMTQQRVVSLYDFGGGGIINKTTVEPVSVEHARKILDYVGWSGIALFDFMKVADGEYYLIECNPKIWGTTEVTTVAGMNMVQQHVDLYIEGIVPTPAWQYKNNILYKYWIPECIFHWIHRPFNIKNLMRRLRNTFSRHGAVEVHNNIRIKNLRHLAGIIINHFL